MKKSDFVRIPGSYLFLRLVEITGIKEIDCRDEHWNFIAIDISINGEDTPYTANLDKKGHFEEYRVLREALALPETTLAPIE